ncbi:uncharacterized protein LOC129756000 isoform X2 [Uranotaenia lowii]|nr:uncharacterized protein LOC129756000 isoform X2 [Uranotaenia lowii]
MSDSSGGSTSSYDPQQKQQQRLQLQPSTEEALEALTQRVGSLEVTSVEHLLKEEQFSKELIPYVNFGGQVPRDRNNNNLEYSRGSQVMMMVAKYESAAQSGKAPSRDETSETSDFETASVSSVGSGRCSTGASVRSSSAFSEGSRDLMSLDSYGKPEMAPVGVVGRGESHMVTAGNATITINIINKTADECDTIRPSKTCPETKAVQVQVPSNDELESTTGEELTLEESSTECEEDVLDRTELYSPYDSRLFQTAESQEFIDCKDHLDSSNSGYDDGSEGTEDQHPPPRCREAKQSRQSPKVIQKEATSADEPMINIIQELNQDMQVTSTVILNKAKIKEHRKSYSAEKKQKQKREKTKLENSYLNRQKIINDNFCNEILDSSHHYGLNKNQDQQQECLMEVMSDSALPGSSIGDESFDSSMSYGKLEGKPRYSGRPVGKLMAKRLKKFDRKKLTKTSSVQSDSSTASNYANGPKKPPRTFTTPKNGSKIGWVESLRSGPKPIVPSCPTLTDLGSDSSSKNLKNKREKTHEIGWTVPKESKNESTLPPHIYSMLHYSDDETRKRLIKTSHSQAVPQSSICCEHKRKALEPVGTKLDIDAVDGVTIGTPRRKTSSNLDFERFVANSKIKSTPHKQPQKPSMARRTELFLDSEKKRPDATNQRRRTVATDSLEWERRNERIDFLDDGRRSDHEPPPDESSSACKKCSEKSQKVSFRKSAVRRTKSFFEASKKKIHLQSIMKKDKEKERFETPRKQDLDSNLNREHSVKKQLHKHLGYTPDHLRCGSCPKEARIVKNNLTEVNSAPARMADYSRPNLPTRTVLNFSGQDVTDSNLDSVTSPSKSAKTHELKFLKTLKNLKISPKKIFKSGDNSLQTKVQDSSSPRQLGDFQSYDDLNLDNVAQMGDFLNNVRQLVETERNNSQELIIEQIYREQYGKTPRNRLISTSSEFLDRPARMEMQVAADLHREPIYYEISPKNSKTLVNHFLSNSGAQPSHYMGNNNPNVIYATVNKTRKNLIKSNSPKNHSNQQQPVSAKKLNADPSQSQLLNSSSESHYISAYSRPRRSLFSNNTSADSSGGGDLDKTRTHSHDNEDNDISVLQEDDNDDRDRDQDECFQTPQGKMTMTGGRTMTTTTTPPQKPEPVQEPIIERKIARNGRLESTAIIGISGGNDESNGVGRELQGKPDDGYREFREDIRGVNSGTMAKNVQTNEERLLKSAAKSTDVAMIGRAPLGYIDTDDEVESLQKYQEGDLDDLLTILRENITISEVGTVDTESEAYVTGFDTVDCMPITPGRRNNLEAAGGGSDRQNSTIDTDNISELAFTAHDYSVSNLSPVNSSPSNSGKMRMNGSDIYRTFKDKLRSSFRKSKNFIRNEQRKFVSRFDDRSLGRKEEGYRVAFDLDAYMKKYEKDTVSDEIYQTLSATESQVELNNRYLAELIAQIKNQCDARRQLKQALSTCRSTREFECSSELIEAERLMLLTMLKETAARNELTKVDYHSEVKFVNEGKKVGLVALNHFEFPLKDTAINDMMFNYFYVVVCSYKNQVKATLAKERYENRVMFRNCEIKFHDLDADYEIRVEIFVLRIRKNAKNYSFESKYHLNKDAKGSPVTCPTPPKLLASTKFLTGSRSSSPKNFDFDNEFSRFKSQGFVTLTSANLLPSNGGSRSCSRIDDSDQIPYYSASGNFQQIVRRRDANSHVYLVEDFKSIILDSMVYSSNLVGNIGMSIKSEVTFVDGDISGFLTVAEGRNGFTNWSRKWCKVNGFLLEFWNYPQECQEKLPTLQIDLTKCINEEVEQAERTICSRARTFRVDIIDKASGSCSSSGISSYKDTDSHHHQQPASPTATTSSGISDQHQQASTSGSTTGSNSTKNYLLSADTPAELKMWLNELNRIVKFLKQWKI